MLAKLTNEIEDIDINNLIQYCFYHFNKLLHKLIEIILNTKITNILFNISNKVYFHLIKIVSLIDIIFNINNKLCFYRFKITSLIDLILNHKNISYNLYLKDNKTITYGI